VPPQRAGHEEGRDAAAKLGEAGRAGFPFFVEGSALPRPVDARAPVLSGLSRSDRTGDAAMAKMLKAEMKPLGGAEVQGNSDEDLKKVITQGSGKMKPITGVAEKQVDDVVAYVSMLKQ
jgi:hypothetical protein